MESVDWVTKLEMKIYKLRETLDKALQFIEAEGEYGDEQLDEVRDKLIKEVAGVLEETE